MPSPGPTSSTTSPRSSSASRPITPRMFSSTRKCWPSSRLGTTGSRVIGESCEREGGPGVRLDAGLERARLLVARRRQRPEGVDDVRRLVLTAPHRLRREVRAVGLGQDPVGGHGGRRGAELLGFRIRDVAGERDVVAALERSREESGRREAVENDDAVERGQRTRRFLVCGSRVDDHGLSELMREGELPLEELELSLTRRVVAVEVEPGLAHGDRAFVRQKLAKLWKPRRFLAARLARVYPKRRVYTFVLVREAERRPTRLESRADRDDSRDTDVARASDERRGPVLGGVEVRVSIDHGRPPADAAEPVISRCRAPRSRSETLVPVDGLRAQVGPAALPISASRIRCVPG